MQASALSAVQIANPFMLMMEPQTVLRAMAGSSDLRRLRHHKYRPLDRPLIPYASKKSIESLTKGGKGTAARLDS